MHPGLPRNQPKPRARQRPKRRLELWHLTRHLRRQSDREGCFGSKSARSVGRSLQYMLLETPLRTRVALGWHIPIGHHVANKDHLQSTSIHLYIYIHIDVYRKKNHKLFWLIIINSYLHLFLALCKGLDQGVHSCSDFDPRLAGASPNNLSIDLVLLH